MTYLPKDLTDRARELIDLRTQIVRAALAGQYQDADDILAAALQRERDEAAERAIAFESMFVKNLDPKITTAYMNDLRAAILADQPKGEPHA